MTPENRSLPNTDSKSETQKTETRSEVAPLSSFVHEIISFTRVTPTQQIGVVSHLSVIAIPMAHMALDNISEGNYSMAIVTGAISVISTAVIGSNCAEAVYNYKSYKKAKKLFTKHGWDNRIVKPLTRFWCQRNAVSVAAIEAGYKQQVSQYFNNEGYKWYDLLPHMRSGQKSIQKT